eukprot:Clim_evm106s109 gene=Clim_evmTU106s109
MAPKQAGSVALDHIIIPTLLTFTTADERSMTQIREIGSIFEEAERSNRGFTKQFLQACVKEGGLDLKVSDVLQNIYNKEQAKSTSVSGDAAENAKSTVQLLAYKLCTTLTKIQDQFNDRSIFLSTIKNIASMIKDLLEAVNAQLLNEGRDGQSRAFSPADRKTIDEKKKAFILTSKTFSESLKDYFKRGNPQVVITAANDLIKTTNSLVAAMYTAR